jgi:dTDP-4-dehydrorhamnose 3,5-epimerase
MGAGVKIGPTSIAGLMLVETSAHRDDRGEFARLFCERELQECLQGRRIVQINRSVTRTVGAVRGMHYQRPPHAEMKFVRCLRGRVLDVVIDLRAGSPAFRQWSAHELSAANAHMLVIPEGFAHGFQVLEPDSELLYLHTAFYEPRSEGAVGATDPAIGIRWPLPISEMSERDRRHPPLTPDFTGLEIS